MLAQAGLCGNLDFVLQLLKGSYLVSKGMGLRTPVFRAILHGEKGRVTEFWGQGEAVGRWGLTSHWHWWADSGIVYIGLGGSTGQRGENGMHLNRVDKGGKEEVRRKQRNQRGKAEA